MARWLLDGDSGIPERVLELMRAQPKGKRSFNPFRDPEFHHRFNAYISQHRHKLSTFYPRYKLLRQKFRVVMKRNTQPPWWSAETLAHSVTFFRGFFRKHKYQQLAYIEHEMTHVVQFLLERRKPGPVAAMVETETSYAPRSYYNDRDEIEPWTKDFYRDILHLRKRGKLKTDSRVAAWLHKNKHFRCFYKHNQERMLRKILKHLRDT